MERRRSDRELVAAGALNAKPSAAPPTEKRPYRNTSMALRHRSLDVPAVESAPIDAPPPNRMIDKERHSAGIEQVFSIRQYREEPVDYVVHEPPTALGVVIPTPETSL